MTRFRVLLFLAEGVALLGLMTLGIPFAGACIILLGVNICILIVLGLYVYFKHPH